MYRSRYLDGHATLYLRDGQTNLVEPSLRLFCAREARATGKREEPWEKTRSEPIFSTDSPPRPQGHLRFQDTAILKAEVALGTRLIFLANKREVWVRG